MLIVNERRYGNGKATKAQYIRIGDDECGIVSCDEVIGGEKILRSECQLD